jgi:hypothetical protein
VPLVQSAEDPLDDEARSTHVNMMRAITEPLDPDADDENGGGRRRGRWLFAAVGAGLVVLSVLGYVLTQGGSGAGQGEAADVRTPAATGSVEPAATATGLTALPVAGDFGFRAAATLPAPGSPVVGAVQLAYFDGFLYAAAVGQDGNVRVSSVPLGGSGGGSWAIVPGIATEVQPALVGSPAGRLELYVTTSAGTVVRAVLGAPGSGWSSWQKLGTQHVAGAPAAAAVGPVTQVFAASADQRLLQGTIAANGVFAGWHALPQGGRIQAQVAVAAQGRKLAVYVVRSSDGATLRVYDDGSGWQNAWPTGAAGQPATAYAADGHPDLFVLSPSAGLQVFQFSGADLHGTMTWAPAGVNTVNPPGVTSAPNGGVQLTAVGADGRVGVYTTTR